jgi:hypothetical protein
MANPLVAAIVDLSDKNDNDDPNKPPLTIAQINTVNSKKTVEDVQIGLLLLTNRKKLREWADDILNRTQPGTSLTFPFTFVDIDVFPSDISLFRIEDILRYWFLEPPFVLKLTLSSIWLDSELDC